MWQRSFGCRAELLHFAVRAMGSSLGMDMDGCFYVHINSSLVLSTQREVLGYPRQLHWICSRAHHQCCNNASLIINPPRSST